MGEYTRERLKERLQEDEDPAELDPQEEYNLPDQWEHSAREYAENPEKLVEEVGENQLGTYDAVHKAHIVDLIRDMDGGEEALQDAASADPESSEETAYRTYVIHVRKQLRDQDDVMELEDGDYYRYKE